jgi:cytochrome c peroxidase
MATRLFPQVRFPIATIAALMLLTFTATAGAAQRGGGADRAGNAGGRTAPATPLPDGVPLGLRTTAILPADNPITPEKVELGRLLFFDPILSADRTVSCASCHRPEFGFGDTLRVSAGIDGRFGHRNSPTLLNRVFGRRFFWDGRATTLEQAVLMPVADTLEMALPLEDLVERVSDDGRYAGLFRSAFPGAAITDATIARALASYVRTLWTGDSPFDRYQAGDSTALSTAAQRGRALFFGRANCSDCHSGPNFTDEQFHVLGVSGAAERFKTPTLRDVALTGPYMHDGSLRSLEDVVEFYDRGGNGVGAGQGRARGGGRRIRPLGLTPEERTELVAFLRALTGTVVEAFSRVRGSGSEAPPVTDFGAARSARPL